MRAHDLPGLDLENLGGEDRPVAESAEFPHDHLRASHPPGELSSHCPVDRSLAVAPYLFQSIEKPLFAGNPQSAGCGKGRENKIADHPGLPCPVVRVGEVLEGDDREQVGGRFRSGSPASQDLEKPLHIGLHFAGPLITLARVLGQRPFDDMFEFGRNARPPDGQRNSLGVLNAIHNKGILYRPGRAMTR